MAKNREPEKPVEESESESSEKEEGDEASSEEIGSDGSDSEPELTQVAKKPSLSAPATLKKQQPQSSSKPQQQPPSSSEDSGSGSESESDSDGPAQNVKPIATKAMADLQKSNSGGGARKPRSASELATPAKGASGKRTAEEGEKDGKDEKKKPDVENSEKKSGGDDSKKLFQRIWSEDDEIMILKGMISYASKKKADPVADLNAFHDYIKKNLHFDKTKTQLQDKIRRLRKKYENNKRKGKQTLSKPHEQKAYELSEKIWGPENGKENGGEKQLVLGSPKADGGTARKAVNKKAVVAVGDEVRDGKNAEDANGDLDHLLPAKRLFSGEGSVEEMVYRVGNEMFEGGEGLEEEKQWKKLKLMEMELYMKRLEVKTAQTKLVLDVLKSAD